MNQLFRTEAQVSDDDVDQLIDAELREEIGDPIPVTFAATVVYVPLLFAGLALALWSGAPILGAAPSLRSLLGDLGLGLVTGLTLVGITCLLTPRMPPLERLSAEFRQLLGPLGHAEILRLALLSGLAEEVLFRGWLQPQVGWILASILFGLLHFVPSKVFLPWTVFALGAGFAFGGLAEFREGSIVAPTVAHIVVNGVNLRLIVGAPSRAPA
jgi:membrane protease YdiL (CAAX protease family)